MNIYNVYVPITGVLTITVKAENEEEAKEMALDSQVALKIEHDDANHVELNEFEMHKQIVRGNVFHGCMNDIDVELVEEYDENEEQELDEMIGGELSESEEDDIEE
jgi:hypothetical protein